MRSLSLTTLLLASSALSALAHPPAGHLAVRAGRTFDGVRWHDRATVVLRGDRVEAVRLDGSVPAGVTLLDRPDAVLTPGLVDLDSVLGLSRGRDERHEALSPDLVVSDAFAPEAGELEALRRSGVTSLWLSPGPSGVLAGRGAVVQPAMKGKAARLLLADWGPSGSLSAEARVPHRAPSSLPLQFQTLQSALGVGLPGPLRVRVDDAAAAAQGARLEGALLVGQPADSASIRELGGTRGVVLTGLGPGAPPRAFEAAAELHSSGARLGFGTDDLPGGPEALRPAAARAVQAGLDPAAALMALTGGAAGLARLPGARGTVTRGAIADLVLWSEDPVEPASRPLLVWVGGEEVHRED